jgi:cobalt-zinc-cadmium resistance protein CzcA
MPAPFGNLAGVNLNTLSTAPRRRLGDLVKPLSDPDREAAPGHYVRPGASTIYREQGNRLIAVKFSVRGRDLAGAVADAQARVADLIHPPYRMEWSGEFQELQEAEGRLLYIIPLSLAVIFVLLYLAFRSLLDAVVIFSNVVALSLGGIWALLLTGTNSAFRPRSVSSLSSAWPSWTGSFPFPTSTRFALTASRWAKRSWKGRPNAFGPCS